MPGQAQAQASDHRLIPSLITNNIYNNRRNMLGQVWDSQVNCTWPMNVTNLFVCPRNNALPVTDNTSHRVTSNAHTCDVGRGSVTPLCVTYWILNINPTWRGHKIYLNSISKSLSDDLEKANSDPSVPHTKRIYNIRMLRFKSMNLAHDSETKSKFQGGHSVFS